MQLKEMATIRSGLVLSRKFSREPTKFKYQSLNLRCITKRGHIDNKLLDVYYAKERLGAEYLTQKGDIIIRLSSPYTAILIERETEGLVISSNFVIIRVDEEQLSQGYLHWLINTPKVKRKIFENTTSNMLGAVKPKFFAEFEIDMISLEQQQKIAILNQLAQQECQLLWKLAEEKEKYYALIINEVQCNMRKERKYDN